VNRYIEHKNLCTAIVKEIPTTYPDFIVMQFDSGTARALHDEDQIFKYGVDGYPDITVLASESKWFGFEVKTGRAVQRKSQKIFESRCRDVNGEYHVVRSVTEVMNILDGYMGAA
jgi:hypothetical protein